MRKANLIKFAFVMLLLSATAFLFAYNLKNTATENYTDCKNDKESEQHSDFMILESISSRLYLLNK